MRRFLTKAQVGELLGYHPEHVMRLARGRRFPQPVKFGDSPGCAVRFDADEVEKFLDQRAAARPVTV
jgi:predicted DNA-binding transcriptional regulator AlpA